MVKQIMETRGGSEMDNVSGILNNSVGEKRNINFYITYQG